MGERKGTVVHTLLILGAKNCFRTEHFCLSFLILQAQEKEAGYFKTDKRKHFLKESISLKYVELGATKYQAQKLHIISEIKVRIVILDNSPFIYFKKEA